MFQQRNFEFFGKEALGQDFSFLRQGSRLQLVASGLDNLQFKFKFGEGFAALVEDEVRLCQRQGASAGCNGDGRSGHGESCLQKISSEGGPDFSVARPAQESLGFLANNNFATSD